MSDTTALQRLPEVATNEGFVFLQKYVCAQAKTRNVIEEVQINLQALGFTLQDVMTKRCHVVPNWDAESGSNKFTVITSVHELMARADSTGLLDGIETESDGTNEKNPSYAICTVYKKGCARPFVGPKVFFREYAKKKKDGSLQKMWAEKSNTMLVKVAMAHALRMAFASALMGLYTTDEMPQEPTQEVQSQAETKPAKPKEFYSTSSKADADQLKELKALATQKKNLLSDKEKAILRPLFKSCNQDVFHEWIQKLNKMQLEMQETQETEATELPAEEKPGKMSDEITPAQRTAIEAQMKKLNLVAVREEWIAKFAEVTTRQDAGKFLVMIGRAVLDQQKKAATPSGDQLEDAFSKQE